MAFVDGKTAFDGVPGVEVRSFSANWICLCIQPQLGLKERVVEFFRLHMLVDLPAELCERLAVAIDELLANAIEHGCAEPRFGVELTYIRFSRSIMLQLRDTGPGFDWSKLAHAAVNNPPDNPLHHAEIRSQMGLRPGGFGIMLVRQIADELLYNERGNQVLFVKYL